MSGYRVLLMAQELDSILAEILQHYPTPEELGDGPDARGSTTADFPELRELITQDAENAIKEVLGGRNDEYNIKGQMGQGSAAEIPYIAVLENTETNTTRMGIYVVYLFDPIEKTLYLTLNQGATEAQRCSSRDGVQPTAVDILQNHAAMYREIVSPSPTFKPAKTKLTEDLRRAKEYNAGSICFAEYSLSELQNENQVASDLKDIVDLYDDLLNTLYTEPKVDLDESNVWKISPEGGEYWPDWVADNVASIGYSEEPDPNAPESDPHRMSHALRKEITKGDYIVAGAPIGKIPVVFGIGRVTADYETFQNQTADIADVGRSEFDHTNLVGVDWVPSGEVSEQGGVSANCRKEGNKLFQNWSIHRLKAELGDFIGATSRRMEAAEFVDDASEQNRAFTKDLKIESTGKKQSGGPKGEFGTTADEAVRLYLTEREWEPLDTVARNTASAVRALAEELVAENRMGTEEVTVLYNLCQIPIKKSTLEAKIHDLNLDADSTEEIISKLDENMGIIGRGQFKVQVNPDNERDLLQFFSTILDKSDKSDLDTAIERLADRDPDNIEAGTISPFLYILHPETYPINNGPAREGMNAVFDFDVSRKLEDYVAEVEKFETVRESYNFNSDYRDLDWFLEKYQEYLCEEQEEYDSIGEATDDILERVKDSEYSNPLFGHVALDTIEKWWEALHGFQPNGYADPETAARLFEIEGTLEKLRPELEQIARELNIPGINSLDSAETVFLAFLREYQGRLPIEEDEINANQPKLNALKRRAFHYFEHENQPLVKHLREGEHQVYVPPAPPDYWLSVLRNRLMAFTPDHSEIVTDIESGDIILCYATGAADTARFTDYGGRLIGAGIADTELEDVSGKEFTTLESDPPTDSYNRFLTFDRLFTTAEANEWDGTNEDLSVDHIRLESGALITLYRTGSYHIVGVDSKVSLFQARDDFLDLLRDIGVDVPSGEDPFSVRNIVTTSELSTESVNLNALAIGLELEHVEYEPEQFPGLVYRPGGFDAVVLIFGSGKVVITGLTSDEDARSVRDSVSEEIHEILR